ncbi:sulfite exporter TauE/SafE family protein [Mycolicibacterium sp. 624]|uniref:sulfite exporter TauE/SafE family protein n=1 Tax=Mycolicibacterium sp. 624 TaxID=3156314 RepID=UPI0033918343
MTITLALVFGGFIGVLLGLLGGGGSILAVPALVYAVGLDMEQAIPVSLIVIGLASAVGALPKIRARQVEWRLAGIFAAAGIPATFAGAAIGSHLPQSALLLGFAAMMVIAGIRMLSGSERTGTACKSSEGINWRRCIPRSIPAGFAVGLLTGLFGVGGGFLIIPALVLMLGVTMPIAVGTSLLIIVANSAAGVISHLPGLDINWTVAAAFAVTATTASLVAGHLGTRMNTARLQHWFAYLVFTIAAFVIIDTVFLR